VDNLSHQIKTNISEIVFHTHFQDTHEHLPPEFQRIEEKAGGNLDFSYLFSHYLDSDLLSAGMLQKNYEQFFGNKIDSNQKWKLVSPFYQNTRSTGYGQCLRKSLKILWEIDDLDGSNCNEITQLLNEHVKPGFYREILQKKSLIDHVQINSLQFNEIFRNDPNDADLFSHDFGTLKISTQWDIDVLANMLGKEISSLHDAHDAIAIALSKWGEKAISIKDPCAYWRDLDFYFVSDEDAQKIFNRYLISPDSISVEEYNAVGNNLFRYALKESEKYSLPVKIHTGYIAGANHMNLERVKKNLEHLQSVISDFPNIRFVLMHITYPLQNELLAMVKHFSNVYVDMCWAWIIDPISSQEFLSKFLVTAPHNKIFTFGGDFVPVELIPGHAQMAREGIIRSIDKLIQEDYLNHNQIEELIEKLMNKNAKVFFDI
jgi:hypothetical protein